MSGTTSRSSASSRSRRCRTSRAEGSATTTTTWSWSTTTPQSSSTKEDPSDLVDIFEIATAQLLELRFYDAMLSRSMERLLRDVRRARTTTWLVRSPFRKLARRAAILTLELGEMTDRLERAITLVGDTYSSIIYREAAVRFRLAETRTSVREKVSIIDRLSEALGYEIHARRDLVLETLVVFLIALEIVTAFRH